MDVRTVSDETPGNPQCGAIAPRHSARDADSANRRALSRIHSDSEAEF